MAKSWAQGQATPSSNSLNHIEKTELCHWSKEGKMGCAHCCALNMWQISHQEWILNADVCELFLALAEFRIVGRVSRIRGKTHVVY